MKKTEFYKEHVEGTQEGVHSTSGDNSNEIPLVLDEETKEPAMNIALTKEEETNWSSAYVLVILVLAAISIAIVAKLKLRHGRR